MKRSFKKHLRNSTDKGNTKFVVSRNMWAFLHSVKYLSFVSARNCEILALRFSVEVETLTFLIAAYGGRVSYGS